jgi:hypothetical protein
MSRGAALAGSADRNYQTRTGDMIVENHERLLTPGEVALMFRVDPKTVTRWASAGRIGSIRTPAGTVGSVSLRSMACSPT